MYSMTKRKANPLPKGGQPGNRNAAKEVTLVGIRISIRPDQLAALDATGNRSKAARDAIDLLISSRDGK
jgi:hypothetical protein